MMSKSKSITDLVTQLQDENEQAKFFYKLFAQAVKHEFGYSVEELHDIIWKCDALERSFREKQGQQPAASHGEQ